MKLIRNLNFVFPSLYVIKRCVALIAIIVERFGHDGTQRAQSFLYILYRSIFVQENNQLRYRLHPVVLEITSSTKQK